MRKAVKYDALQLADDLVKWPYERYEAAAELRRLHALNAELVEALRHISLCSQNSMSSQRECGEIARAALAKVEASNGS